MRRFPLVLCAALAACAAPAPADRAPSRPAAVELAERQRFAAAETRRSDGFGDKLAVSGSRLLVGAPRAGDAGSAYTFRFDGGEWQQEATLVPGGAEGSAQFGDALALDGDRAVVGASGDGGRGAVYVFDRVDGGWAQTARLTPADPADDQYFGGAVALSGDRLLVGASGDAARRDGPGGYTAEGAAYVFELAGGAWAQTAKLAPPPSMAASGLGWAVALDGGLAVVGGHRDRGVGAVAVYERGGGGWSPAAVLRPADGARFAQFGASLSLSGDRLAVGASGDGPAREGAVYVYDRAGGAWAEAARLTDVGGPAEVGFGHALALDGDRLLVGIPALISQEFRGAVALFARGADGWARVDRRVSSDATPLDNFGQSVALSGTTAFVGAGVSYLDERPDVTNTVYAFALSARGR